MCPSTCPGVSTRRHRGASPVRIPPYVRPALDESDTMNASPLSPLAARHSAASSAPWVFTLGLLSAMGLHTWPPQRHGLHTWPPQRHGSSHLASSAPWVFTLGKLPLFQVCCTTKLPKKEGAAPKSTVPGVTRRVAPWWAHVRGTSDPARWRTLHASAHHGALAPLVRGTSDPAPVANAA